MHLRRLLTFLLAILAPGVVAEAPGPDHCIHLEGELTPGGLLWGQVAPGSRVTVNDEPLVVLDDGSTMFGLGRNAVSPVKLVVEGPNPCERAISIRPLPCFVISSDS